MLSASAHEGTEPSSEVLRSIDSDAEAVASGWSEAIVEETSKRRVYDRRVLSSTTVCAVTRCSALKRATPWKSYTTPTLSLSTSCSSTSSTSSTKSTQYASALRRCEVSPDNYGTSLDNYGSSGAGYLSSGSNRHRAPGCWGVLSALLTSAALFPPHRHVSSGSVQFVGHIVGLAVGQPPVRTVECWRLH